MNVSILYRPNTDHERLVTDFQENFRRQTGRTLDLISLDTKDGAGLARTYDIVQYPAVIARDDMGQLLKVWQGESLPLMNEVMYYSRENLAT